MKIIKHGQGYITFTCKSCGCVFKASKIEYETIDLVRFAERVEYNQCKCPECGMNVQTKEVCYENQ